MDLYRYLPGTGEAVVAGLILIASALPMLIYFHSRQQKQFESQMARLKEKAAADKAKNTVHSTVVADTAETPPPRAMHRKKTKSGDSDRPVLLAGTRCYVERKGREYEATIIEVHHDDSPPYYTVRLADGTVVDTVRSRIESLAERADAFAAELLAEEEHARKGKRKPSSGHEKAAKGGSGHERSPQSNNGHDKGAKANRRKASQK
mmetsp:Transcript_11394/g.19146  ORF Transcript_11394/g.19146 Transcript_11394/m.19146 type:complete len:206 (-) Transcript_11394:402-1019(-)|eukprot:CAMPEP_0119308016 /NCGR_PEP_ID=MMETSP1333-20130426/8353_1 /TAXON_ID=418940 /ORGANISM="Scyphosphaera apsteinii, Strain RCC1455" /LENGTH=205 /DNA_ID=CAMNT_0007311697 /DNA_START=64 /DNA_END=681 /DNA_ORIENTATION=-